MKRTATLFCAVAMACNSHSSSAPSGAATLNGSGSTFQKPYQETAIAEFRKANGGATINYGGGGSGKGRQDLADMVVDFAGSDAPYKEGDLAKNKGGQVLYFPLLLGPIAITYNVEGQKKLQLSPATIAKIFEREVKSWNDPAIAADNPGATLPELPIVVVHRADGSGTTQNFTEYLNAAASDAWKLKSGSTVEWPPDTQAGQGNPGVAQIVKAQKGAIGYVDLSDAKASGLSYASVKNQAGAYVEPTAASASAAGEGIDIKPDLTFSAINSKGASAYPITYQTWIIVYAKQTDKSRGTLLKLYLRYLLGDGQKLLGELDFAPLPKSLQDRAMQALDAIQVP